MITTVIFSGGVLSAHHAPRLHVPEANATL